MVEALERNPSDEIDDILKKSENTPHDKFLDFLTSLPKSVISMVKDSPEDAKEIIGKAIDALSKSGK